MFSETAKTLSSGQFGSGNITSSVNTYQYTTDEDIPWQITTTIFTEGTVLTLFLRFIEHVSVQHYYLCVVPWNSLMLSIVCCHRYKTWVRKFSIKFLKR